MNRWHPIPLRELGTWYGGGTPAKSRAEFWDGGSIPWLSPKDMGANVLSGTQDHITLAAVMGSAVKIVPAPSVAIVVRSGILERTLPVSLVPFEATLNQDMKAIVAGAGVLPQWLAWGLRAFEPQLLATARKAGTTVASIETSRLQEFELPVPPLAEQRRIIDILEDHLSRLDAATDGLRIASSRLQTLVAADAISIVRGQESDVSVASPTLQEIARVGTGATPRRGVDAYWKGGKIPWVTSGELSHGLINSTAQSITPLALRETSVKLWPAGTLLVAMYGEGRTRGTVGELGIAATTNQACAAIVLHENNPTARDWVRLVLESRYDVMRRQASGGVQPNLNLSHFREMTVPLPDEVVMAELLAHHRALQEASRLARTSASDSIVRTTALRRALLSAAFSGQLTGRSSNIDLPGEMGGA